MMYLARALGALRMLKVQALQYGTVHADYAEGIKETGCVYVGTRSSFLHRCSMLARDGALPVDGQIGTHWSTVISKPLPQEE